jgi:hypothetical protein
MVENLSDHLVGYCLNNDRTKNRDQWRVVPKLMNNETRLAKGILCVRELLSKLVEDGQ